MDEGRDEVGASRSTSGAGGREFEADRTEADGDRTEADGDRTEADGDPAGLTQSGVGRGLAAAIDDAKRAMVAGRDVPWLLQSWVERAPDKPFLIWEPFDGESSTWTYGEFGDEVQQLAAGLYRRGVRLGDRVLLHLDNSPEFILSWFACAQLGAVAVSTNTRSVARDMEYFAHHARIVAAITSPQFARLVSDSAPDLSLLVVTSTDAGAPADVPTVDHVPFADLPVQPDVNERSAIARPADPMADLGIQFTSGTTSRPKAVLWTHANAIWGSEVTASHTRLRHEDTTLVFLPLFHTNAQAYSMLTTLWVGGTMVVQPRFSATRFWEVSLRHDITWCSLIPFCVKAILAHDVPEQHSYRFWGPGVRLPAVEERFGIKTMSWWGMTETITQGIVGSFETPMPHASIGRASPAYDISIRRPDGTPIGPGERGQLYIRGVRGVSLFKEYADNPEANAAAFDDDGWFDTGDLIQMDEHGNLYFSDRAKDMLKVGAENVAASEIETVVMQTGLVAECAAVGQPHEMLDEVPVVFLIPADGAGDPTDIERMVIDWCAKQLADFKVPRSVFVVDELPRSTLEKVAKNELRARLPTITA